MRHPWVIMAGFIAGVQLAAVDPAPEAVLARRLEHDALFLQRTGRSAAAIQQLEIVQLLQPLPQRDQMLEYLKRTLNQSKGETHEPH